MNIGKHVKLTLTICFCRPKGFACMIFLNERCYFEQGMVKKQWDSGHRRHMKRKRERAVFTSFRETVFGNPYREFGLFSM